MTRKAPPATSRSVFRNEDLADQELALVARVRGEQATGTASQFQRLKLAHHEILATHGGTSHFPILLANVGSKLLRDHLVALPQSYRRLARRVSLRNFKPATVAAHSGFPPLEALNEHGEIKYGVLEEAGETIVLTTRGRIVSLSRKAIVNDDIGAFDSLSRSTAQRIASDRNAQLWAVVRSGTGANGPMISDGEQFFSAAHGNLAGSGALNETNLGVATAMMRSQLAMDGETKLGVEPRFLVVSVHGEQAARKLLADLDSPLELVVEPELGDDASWYVFADPMQHPAFVFGTLFDEEPGFVSRRGFQFDGFEFKVVDDFGVGAGDWRAAVKTPLP